MEAERLMWSVFAGPSPESVVIEAELGDRRRKFMSGTTLTKHRGNAKKRGGSACADAYVRYSACFDAGVAMDEHRPGALEWLEARTPWHAEPYYDPAKRGQTIVDGKAVLYLKDKATALLFKLTWG